jgi:hypothetical protein
MISAAAELSKQPRCDTDITLVIIFRFQVIIVEILVAMGTNAMGTKSTRTNSIGQPLNMNAEQLIEVFQERIQLVNNQISPDMLQNRKCGIDSIEISY